MNPIIINEYHLPDDLIQRQIASYEQESGRIVDRAEFILEDGNIDELYSYWEPVPFVHVRRITGYLATTTNWNNSKLAELADRTKNKLTEGIE